MFQGLIKKPSSSSSSSSFAKIEGFTEKETIALFQAGKIRKVEDGDYIIRKGVTCSVLTLALEGPFKIMLGPDSNRSVLTSGRKWNVFGNPDLSKEKKHYFSVISAGSSRVLEIDQFAFNLLSPEIQASVYRKLLDTSAGLSDEVLSQSEVLGKKIDSLVSYAKSFHSDSDQYSKSVMVRDIITSFPRLPIQINKLTSMLLDEGASANEIVGFAKMDPSIVSVVLKTVNSGFYSFQRKISDFHHAFVLLGFNQVYQILMENFLQGVMPKHFNLRALNLHSAVISQIAFDIAQLSKKSKPVMMSTLGILHDLGKCVILVSKAKRPELDIVMTRLNDCKVGSLLLDTWNTPAIICQSVEFQQYPHFCSPKDIPEDCLESVAILYIAHLCFDYLSGNQKEEFADAFLEEYMDTIELRNYSIESLVSQHILPSLTRKIDVFPDYVRDFIKNQQPSVVHPTKR
jgi:HD-like signal output (HDOD) protein